ncbi:hypothetical protein A2U01_0068328, partial [Trifolium medium]|nr:hypothetical protein [Trifolium medium]
MFKSRSSLSEVTARIREKVVGSSSNSARYSEEIARGLAKRDIPS